MFVGWNQQFAPLELCFGYFILFLLTVNPDGIIFSSMGAKC